MGVLQNEDPDVVCPQSEILQIVMDPTPYSGPNVEIVRVHTDAN